MTPLAKGRIVLWQGGSLWALRVTAPPGGPKSTDFHAHHAIQVTLALDGRYELHLPDRSIGGPALVVAPDARHALEPKGTIALLFVEPESPAGRAILSDILRGDSVAVLPPELLGDFRQRIATAFAADDGDVDRLRRIGQDLTRLLAGGGDPPVPDPRVQASIDWAVANLDEAQTISASAARAGLSVDRMSHLFVEQTGLPFRTYVLWLRISRAVELYAQGSSLTEAAHDAGFADSAHFQPHLPPDVRRRGGGAGSGLAVTFKCGETPSPRKSASTRTPTLGEER